MALWVTVTSQCSVKTAKYLQHAFNSPLSGTTQVSRYQKGKTNLDLLWARDSEWHCIHWWNSN